MLFSDPLFDPTSAKIAQLTGDDQRSIRRWVKHYNHAGLDGLVDAPRSGRPPKLPRDKEQAFKDRIAGGPTEDDLAGGVSVMHGRPPASAPTSSNPFAMSHTYRSETYGMRMIDN